MSNSLKHLCVLILICAVSYCDKDNGPRIQTTLGTVLGKVTKTGDGTPIYSYTGIPYIKPPVGDLRFRAPQPADPWDGELSATGDIPMCLQSSVGTSIGTEDCVVLNVFTPWGPSEHVAETRLSVMVYIHGGGFISGSSGPPFMGGPDYIVQHGVVLVTINYRVGIMGFLSTEDIEAPGNYGLLDQVEALKWVKSNIASFGGNPDDVTIFGHSAGSASVHFHMLSPLSKGLFHRAIGHSGVALCPWATTKISNKLAQTLAAKVGCPTNPSSALIKCLRKTDASKLASAEVIEENKKHLYMPFIWSPRIDSEAKTPFLPKHPIELMEDGDFNKVPALLGHTTHEGAMLFIVAKDMFEKAVADIERRWDNTCKVMLSLREFLISEEKGTELCEQIKSHYIDDDKSFKENLMSYVNALGHAWITQPIYKASELMSKHSAVYSYLFNYETENVSLGTLVFPGGNKEKGIVCHGDDMMYSFKYPSVVWSEDSKGMEIVEKVTKLWTDFAKTGKPSIPGTDEPWPEASWPNHKYVFLDTEPTILQNYNPEDMDAIDEIYSHSLYKTTSPKDEL